MSVNDARQRIRESQKDTREHGSNYLAILLKETGDLTGWIGVFMPAARRALQLGFWLGERYQDNGYMTEGLLAALPVAMKRLRKRSIAAECFEDNLASIRVLEHIGMVRCGSGLAVSKARSRPFPTIKFSMSQSLAL